MLDVLRRHASSWIIKVILGAIILTFVLFFGYAGLEESFRRSDDEIAATVNDTAISKGLQRFYTERNYESLKQTFGGEQVPDFVHQFASSNAMRQLLFRSVSLQEADQLGLMISDEELADAILEAQKKQNGTFDPIFYRHRFLPYFAKEYGFQYERILRDDLRIELLQKLFGAMQLTQHPSEEEFKRFKNETWTFEVVEINDSQDKTIAQLFLSEPSKKSWEELVRKHQLTIKKIGPLSLEERQQLPGTWNLEDQKHIFSLTPENTFVKEPIRKEKTEWIVRLVAREAKKKQTKDEDASFSMPSIDFFEQWISQKITDAKVRSSLDS